MYLGTYSQNGSEGIYVWDKGGLRLAAKLRDASWVCRAGEGLLAISELTGQNGETEGELVLFRIEADGSLTQTGRAGTGGLAPCHIMYAKGRAVVSNYLSGNVAVFEVMDGMLTFLTALNLFDEGEKPGNAHCAVDLGGFALFYVCDLGLDAVFEMNPSMHQKTRIPLPKGCGPRHAAASKDGEKLYVITEKSCEVMVIDLKTRTVLSQHPLCDKGYEGFAAAAAIRLHPDGSLLAASPRGNDKVVLFGLDDRGGIVWRKDVGLDARTPRDIAFSPDGASLCVAYENGGRVDLFQVEKNGTLIKSGAIALASVVSICF